MSEVTAELLIEACEDKGQDGGITIQVDLEPLGGPGAPVKPAIYAGGLYQTDRRWRGEENDRVAVDAIVIDNVPSQANRLEAALEDLRGELGLPELILDLSEQEPLPAHVPRRLSSFRFPHRQADAYLRDASLEGQPFIKSKIGRALADSTADRPHALFEWFPQALLLGFWQSHLGKKGSQAKLARSWVSEVIGYRPAAEETRQFGLKGDPLNLNVDEVVEYDPDDVTDWQWLEGSKKAGGSKKKESLAELGHGQVPVSGPEAPRAGVSFAEIEQRATVSFAGLRRVWVDKEKNAAARALLVSLGLVAHSAAFGRSFSLRSGCELRPINQSWTWLGERGDESLEPLTVDEAITVFRGCVERAEATGLPVGGRWAKDPLILAPNDQLGKVIRSTYPAPE